MQVALRIAAVATALSATFGVAACGGSEPTTRKTAPPVVPTAKPNALAGNALSTSYCAPDAEGEGVWSAGGTLKNSTKRAVSYDVIVYIGPADGQQGPAVVKRVSDVAPGKTAPFSISPVQAASASGPCHLQVRIAKNNDDE
jgi:hypothetical protein